MLFIQPVYNRYTYILCVKSMARRRDSIELDRIMRLIHNSRLPQFRTPFGAVTTGTTLSLSVILEDADPAQATLTLRTWVDEIGESRYPMTHEGDGIFTVELECTEPCLIWYSFICNIEGQPEVRLGAPQGRTGGEGVTYDYAEVPSFQVTVYKHRENRPTWYERGMVYQIFPDRYARDEHWRERTLAEVEKPRNGIQRRMVEDWNEPPVYERAEDGSIKTWDFYGGSLKGIQEDLPRIAELGFTAIYLNPIFEAASNHRYDTADYTKIDPILGTEQDFTELCEAAEKLGISIILDGVFNHTGDDSIYFNRYGNYPGVGAWQSEDSPWRDAFYFHEDGSYDCWWGVGNMPAINESSDLVRERLLGKDGVIRKWLRAGAHGWRLDVADELSDDFLTEIKKAVLAEKPDALLLGEVWEDASNKISYGHLRRYLQGSELDSAMDYPFRDMVIGFLMGYKNATRQPRISKPCARIIRARLCPARSTCCRATTVRALSRCSAAAPTSRSCPRASAASGAWTSTRWAWPRAAFGSPRLCR